MNKPKLKKILQAMNGERIDFSEFDSAVSSLRKSLEEKVAIPTLDKVNSELDKFRQKVDIEPLIKGVEELKAKVQQSTLSNFRQISVKTAELERMIEEGDQALTEKTDSLSSDVAKLSLGLITTSTESAKNIKEVKDKLVVVLEKLPTFADGKMIEEKLKTLEERDNTEELKDYTDKTRIELLNKMAERGGGNANRNIAIGGNTSVLSKYGDINLKAGANVTITYQNNNTTRYTDITIAATGGGGGSVTGIIRSISNISTSQTAGATAGTDYVYICTAGVQVTLPTAVGNLNRYTVKNISNSSVLVSGTIDNDATGVIMPVKYTSVDIISNNVDWDIT